jgi:hypothetical protein
MSSNMAKAEQILEFYADLDFNDPLPDGISMMNPYRENAEIRRICQDFYQKFYADDQPRRLILGINPGRLGAGATGLPFTDTKRLMHDCGIDFNGFVSHEPSSVFVYLVIKAYGGPMAFYRDFYINSVCPLGFTKTSNGKEINYNYYDSKELTSAVLPFILFNIPEQIKIAGRKDICYVFGTGKNYEFVRRLNDEHQYFDKVIGLEHPRYIMQYKAKKIDQFVDSYLRAFDE